jgi:hypothetical protein
MFFAWFVVVGLFFVLCSLLFAVSFVYLLVCGFVFLWFWPEGLFFVRVISLGSLCLL